MLRRGLPRVPGGEPWPPADAVRDVGAAAAVEAAAVPVAGTPDMSERNVPAAGVSVPAAGVGVTAARVGVAAGDVGVHADDVSVPATDVADAGKPRADAGAPASGVEAQPSGGSGSGIRRGLPRVAGGDPWPPADAAIASASVGSGPSIAGAVGSDPSVETSSAAPVEERPAHALPPTSSGSSAGTANGEGGSGIRRGLPRVAGGEAWPPASTVIVAVPASPTSTTPGLDTPDVGPNTGERPVGAPASAPEAGAPTGVAVASGPLPFSRTVWAGTAPRRIAPAPASDKKRPTGLQALAGLFGLAALGILGVAMIALVRAIMPTPFMQDFLAAFPGEYHLPEGSQPGIPGWVGWQHFFNMFLMVLIIRTGLTVRAEKRPTVFWTSRRNPKHKISLTLWLHQALDALWLVNGVVFVVLLFSTGHWVRVVPTSWEVFPNALSAGLQYLSLDWPTENGWANYNSLQQLAYFTTIFIAAPLATITGVRMSGFWPKNAERLNKLYPVEWARAVHFPVMLYFVAFIVVHVILVMATGALRNLNHMYASLGSTDGTAYAANWTGFWVFLASLAVVGAAWLAVRPLIIAPMAKLFGNVSGR